MNETHTLELLSAFPETGWIEKTELDAIGIDDGTRKELMYLSLIIRNPNNWDQFHLSIPGKDWIREYHQRNRTKCYNYWMFGMTLAILVLTLVLVLHAFWSQ